MLVLLPLMLISSFTAVVVETGMTKDDLLETFNRYGGPTLLVSGVYEKPFLFRNASKNNQRLEGFTVDLINELRTSAEFDYRLLSEDDPAVGIQDENGAWSGVIHRIITSVSDLAIGPISVTARRQRVVSMTLPFMESGISIVIKKPQVPQSNKSFQATSSERAEVRPFLIIFQPLAVEVWASFIFSTMLVVLLLGVFEHLNQLLMTGVNSLSGYYESLSSATYSVAKAFVLQGSLAYPRTSPGKILYLAWGIFTLTTLIMYMSALTTLMVRDSAYGFEPGSDDDKSINLLLPFLNEMDLSVQEEIKYGTIKDSSIARFLSDSKDSTHARLWESMSNSRLSLLVGSVEEGIRRVRDLEGKYALFLDDVLARYYSQQAPCDLLVIPTSFPRSGYGLVLAKESPYLDLFNNMILKLREKKIVDMYVRKWWPRQCAKEEVTNLRGGDFSKKSSLPSSQFTKAITIVQYAPLLTFLFAGVVASTGSFLLIYLRRARKTKASVSTSAPRPTSTQV